VLRMRDPTIILQRRRSRRFCVPLAITLASPSAEMRGRLELRG
jgi:hypothetical protein